MQHQRHAAMAARETGRPFLLRNKAPYLARLRRIVGQDAILA